MLLSIIKIKLKKHLGRELQMTRKNREWYQNVMMHITSRGNRRNDLFREEDYQVYLSTLEYVLKKASAQFELISYN